MHTLLKGRSKRNKIWKEGGGSFPFLFAPVFFGVLVSYPFAHPASSDSAPVSAQAASSVAIRCSMLCQCWENSLSSVTPWSSYSGRSFWKRHAKTPYVISS